MSIQWFQARCWVFCRLGVRILQKMKKITITISSEFDPWLKNYICCGCFWVAMARHAATGHLYIVVEIYPGQKDWIPRTQANIALIGIGCWKFSEFSILFLAEKVDFLQNYLLKIFENFIRYTANNYLSNAAKLELVSLFV